VTTRRQVAVIIRPYAALDLGACLDVWLRASRIGHPFLSEADLREQGRLVAETYLPAAENWIVAGAGGQVLGFIGLLDAHVGGLFVDPLVHGRNVGRMLIDHAAALKGALTVEVYEANRAVAFYERCGFCIVGRRDRDDQGRALPLLTMRRDAQTLG
jgi:putative acetyltransferase